MNATWWVAAALVFAGCGSPLARAVRQQRFNEACTLARVDDREGDEALRNALFTRGDLRVHVALVPEAETAKVVGITVPAAEARVVRLRVEVAALFPEATSLVLESIVEGDRGPALGWATWDRRLVDTLCAPRPVPEAPKYLERPYTPTPRPQIPTRTVKRSGAERAVGTLVGLITLGLVDTGDTSEVTTPAGEAALRRWAHDNEAPRAAWEAAERERAEESKRVRADAEAKAARWPGECRAALTAHTAPHCTGSGPAGTLRAGDFCEWSALTLPPWHDETKLYVFSSWRFADGCTLDPPGVLTSKKPVAEGLDELFHDGPRSLQR